jgi:hypothetical protein
MNMTTHSKLAKILIGTFLVGLTANVYAAGKTYTEDEFLTSFSGKSKKVISDKLGAPAKKQLSVKPTNASTMLAGKVKEDKSSKPVKVEMWYYKNLVKYDPKRTYKETEITFVNDRVNGIAFFNNR